MSPGPALHLAGLLFSLHLEFVFVADGETCFHRNDCPRGRLYSQIPRMGRQGTLQGMLGSTRAGQEGLQCSFKKWMCKAGQTALALAVCIFVWFRFFFQCWKSNSEPSGYAHEPHLQLLGLSCLNDSSILWVLKLPLFCLELVLRWRCCVTSSGRHMQISIHSRESLTTDPRNCSTRSSMVDQ